MIKCLIVGIGGLIGSVCRYLLSQIPISNSSSFPSNTLIINFLGALAIGVITGLSIKNSNIDQNLILLLKVGVCGGFTTFSAFSLETVNLINRGEIITSVVYVLLSVLLCLFAVVAGQSIVKYF
ncbi:MAG: CrcB family protein [Eubacteriales bacterium SKADARSKE-1]|nr:CrcB family protein [Eubacteriales bacterium SKADARSKE-1]